MKRFIPGIAVLLLLTPRYVAAEDDSVYMARLVARGFFRALQQGEAAAMLPLCANEVNFDGEVVKGRAAVKKRLDAMARRAREASLRLRRVLLLTHEEALKKLGPPPERLKDMFKPGRMVALAAFQRLGAVAILAREGAFWRVVALTD